jgi:hypothetical protein
MVPLHVWVLVSFGRGCICKPRFPLRDQHVFTLCDNVENLHAGPKEYVVFLSNAHVFDVLIDREARSPQTRPRTDKMRTQSWWGIIPHPYAVRDLRSRSDSDKELYIRIMRTPQHFPELPSTLSFRRHREAPVVTRSYHLKMLRIRPPLQVSIREVLL